MRSVQTIVPWKGRGNHSRLACCSWTDSGSVWAPSGSIWAPRLLLDAVESKDVTVATQEMTVERIASLVWLISQLHPTILETTNRTRTSSVKDLVHRSTQSFRRSNHSIKQSRTQLKSHAFMTSTRRGKGSGSGGRMEGLAPRRWLHKKIRAH